MGSNEIPATPLPLPGITLRRARAERGLTLQGVADATCIPRHSLVALEADDYLRLPAAIYVRGYLRRYGSLLGLDVECLLKDFEAQCPAREESPCQAPGGQRRRPLFLGVGVGVSVLAVLTLVATGIMIAWLR